VCCRRLGPHDRFNRKDEVVENDVVDAVMLCAFAFVVGEGPPFVLEALDVRKGAGVELESEDFSVQTLGSMAE
jgi:hypothetical protein